MWIQTEAGGPFFFIDWVRALDDSVEIQGRLLPLMVVTHPRVVEIVKTRLKERGYSFLSVVEAK